MLDAQRRWKPLNVFMSPLTLKDYPMLNANPNLLFFAYLAVVAALCPICTRVANHSSNK